MSARRIAFIVNVHAGKGLPESPLSRLRKTTESMANGGEISLIDNGQQIDAALRRAKAAQCSVVVAGGGDGTLSSVAAGLVNTGIALGALPLGTLNHFAKDLGIPLEPEAALDAVSTGAPLAVDVGEVNGRYFVNNSSLGLYPSIVHRREQQQIRLGRGKWPAFVWATLASLRRYPLLDTHLTADERENAFRTPFCLRRQQRPPCTTASTRAAGHRAEPRQLRRNGP